MKQEVDIQHLTFTQRIVLLGILEAEVSGEAPVESSELKEAIGEYVEQLDSQFASRPKEQDVMRALNVLGTEPYIGEVTTSTSTSGKGRPKYSLEVEPDILIEALSEDETVGKFIEEFLQH